MIIFLLFFGLSFFFVLHWRHSALPLKELAESRLVAEAQHFGYLLHGKGRVAQADFGFTDKHSRQDAACRVSARPLRGALAVHRLPGNRGAGDVPSGI